MEDKKFEEKDEKQFDEKDEKELRKHDEKVEERDALSSVVWSAILIWAGLVFLAINTGWLDKFMAGRVFSGFMPRGMEMFEPGAWGIIMLGAGRDHFSRVLHPPAGSLIQKTHRRKVDRGCSIYWNWIGQPV